MQTATDVKNAELDDTNVQAFSRLAMPQNTLCCGNEPGQNKAAPPLQGKAQC